MKLNKVGKKLKLGAKKESLGIGSIKSKSVEKDAVKSEPESEVPQLGSPQNKKNKRKFSKAFPAEDDVSESQVKINNKAKNKKNKAKKNTEDNANGIPESEVKSEPASGANEEVSKDKKKRKKQKLSKPDTLENELKSEPAVSDDAKVPKKKKKKKEAASEKVTSANPKNDINGVETPKKAVKPSIESKDSRDSRTIFVGNLPIKFNKKKLGKLFKKCGEIEKIWTRGVIPDDDKISKKVAFAKKLFHKDQLSLVAYILYKTAEDAQKALTLNGEIFEDHHLRVSISSDKSFDKNKGVFVGNLPFNVTDDEIWEMFKNCGEILTVRIIRDLKSGLGKGFGYVNFKSADAVELALQLNEEELQGREIRVKRLLNEGKQKKLKNKKLLGNKNSKPTGSKKQGNLKNANSDSNKPNVKTKKKKSKTDLKKKELAAKLLAKPKKKKEKEVSGS